MNQDLLIGLILLGITAVLIFFGLPNKEGVSPRFLRFNAALVLFPPFILIFLVGGAAEFLKGILRMSH